MDPPSQDPNSTPVNANKPEASTVECPQLQASNESIVTPVDSVVCHGGSKRGPSPEHYDIQRPVKRCQFELEPTNAKIIRVLSVGRSCSVTDERTPEEQIAHRAEIAAILDQATRVALEIGEIDPAVGPRPGGRIRYQRRNSFVDHNRSRGRFSGVAEVPCGGVTVPLADRMRQPSLSLTSRRKLHAENDGNFDVAISRLESNVLLQHMGRSWSTKPESEQDL